jgi:2-polyprenyl-3-methyl-5-hydroxy-6-metoxy-1,4-benzoquinol methylase
MTTEAAKLSELDPMGELTLEVISSAHNFNRWMFETIDRYCKGRVLEVGSGIGNISKLFLEKYDTTLSDLRSNYVDYLHSQFDTHPRLRGIRKMDLVAPDFDRQFSDLFGKFDSIVALNVVEHINDHEQAIANCKKLLAKDGHLIILVPAYQFLYNTFDKELEHFRRYTKKRLGNLLSGQGLQVIHRQHFNLIGMAGWFVSGSLLKKKTIPGGQMKLYNSLVPAFRLIDKVTFNQVGLSVIAVGKKTA